MGKYYNQLSLNDRLTIEKMLNSQQFTITEIAITIGCSRQTIYNELQKGYVYDEESNTSCYSGMLAQKRTINNKKKQGVKLKAINDKKLLKYIEKKITIDKYAPRIIALNIKKYSKKFNTTITDFTIYRYIKIGIFKNLTMIDLPYKKTEKREYQKIQKRASFGESIENRDKEILKRDIFGHWEMDCVCGKIEESKKALLVLSERKTRFELIFLLNGQTMEEVVNKIDYLEINLRDKFPKVFKTITCDNGSEFADNEGIMTSHTFYNTLRTKVYYCHPRVPQERGTNENINKMIRKYIPKGTNFDNKSEEEIYTIQNYINNYPRKILQDDTSKMRLKEELKNINIDIDDYKNIF